MTPDHAHSSGKAPVTNPAGRYRWYVLALLFLALVLNIVDRQILGILQEAIKADLGLSDLQLGMLSGVAFGLFYVTAALIIARYADRTSRKRIVTIALAFWSSMTILCGLAHTYVQLFFARMGVGIGEAGGSPPSHSIIADYFSPGERATALGIYSTGFTIGTVIAFLAGGVVEHYLGWRTAFIVVGVPGLLLAAVVALTLREPVRGYWEQAATGRPLSSPMPTREALLTLFRRRAYVHLVLGTSLQAAAFLGVSLWMPSFFIRSYGLSTLEAGQLLALLIGVMGTLGSIFGGWLSDRLGKRDKRWYVWLLILGNCVTCPLTVAAYMLNDFYLTIGLLTFALFIGNMHHGSVFSLVQGLAEPAIRVTSSAVMLFINGLIAMGITPVVIGGLSELLRPSFGSESLRYALAIVSLAYGLAIAHYLAAARTIRQDLATAAT